VIAAVLRPYREPVLSGPSVALGERAVNNVAMVFHELATNAAKYGAHVVDGGRVTVKWQIQDGMIVLTWRETGGPPVAAPERKGFGSALVESTVAGYGGIVAYDWPRSGLVALIRLPLEAISR
jgi:two-component sensor histidine kinase